MKYLYLPLYRMAVSYVFSFGRRWSIVEHMLLVETTVAKRTALELALSAELPHRLVVEALINLLRANWIEVRSDDSRVYFAATAAGQRRAKEKTLPERLLKDIRWDSVCVDRLTGHWMRADDLDLVYERDLPAESEKVTPLLHTFEPNDAALRDLFRLNLNESLDASTPQFRTPSLPYARVGIAFDEVQTGLPSHAPLALTTALVEWSQRVNDIESAAYTPRSQTQESGMRDEFTSEDLIVGGPAHLLLLKQALDDAKSAIVIHSCFVGADTLRELLPDFERAARRKVRVELLWGLNVDPEGTTPSKKISDALAVLDGLPPGVRGRVRLSPDSSGSHAKVIMYDDRHTNIWITVVGSCNFLSSDFDWLEVSIRSRSALLASRVMSRLLSNQLPSLGNWSPTARRLNGLWSQLKQKVRERQESGRYSVSLITDLDHYACVTLARDQAKRDIEITCDLYGLAAETSVLVPMETAAARGVEVRLLYTRPSKLLLAEGREPAPNDIKTRGLNIDRVRDVHAKYMGWDDDNLVISSFNWMATALHSGRSRGAEIGALIQGPEIRQMLVHKLQKLNETEMDQTSVVSEEPIPS
ncbi:phosphatidylserine synthase [Rhizobium leguminosarum]|uniref:phospholipase D-like domain-containing protein n=1 Tax=Rhizobium leguminosarum TaxID=384 RepID=UPI001C973C88|nr:phospholipase D-like domain-containing protein [Rhizobium leguminosarum]MBY5502347.1 phosphatidylserine synthase [Rhizobium leguminosarum]